MRHRTTFVTIVVAVVAGLVFAQGLLTSQPNLLQIFREEVKIGHQADHVKTESGWPAAFEKAKSPHDYVALTSLSARPSQRR